MSHRSYLFIFLFLSTFLSCEEHKSSDQYDYQTTNDSAYHYFKKGWIAIMDEGRWTDSEKFYRKSVKVDPNFLIGLSLLGRITSDLDERLNIEKELNAKKHVLDKDGRLLLDVYLGGIHFLNQRQLGKKIEKEQTTERFKIAANNFQKFLKKYPNDDYVKAEYIEILHRLYGPELAIDSLKILSNRRQIQLPFYLLYRGTMEVELKNFTQAFQFANRLQKTLNDSLAPNQYLSLAEIYEGMDSIQKAKEMIDKVLKLDSMHLVARGLKSKIYRKINE